MTSPEGGRRQEHGEGPGRILDEDVPVGQRAVKQLLRVALVHVHVPEARSAEEPAVGNGARGQEQRNRDQRGARGFHRPTAAEAAVGPAEAAAAAPGEAAEAAAAESS